MRALIVDDDETSCQLLAKILKHSGIDADWITDSHAGFAKALQCWYDLVVLDVQMPGLLGTDFAAGLKQQRPEVSIVLISAFADEGLYKAATRLGVTLLSKPFPPDALSAVVAQFLSVRV